MLRNKVFIIAEAGINHNGDFDLAKKLVLAAKRSGADAVKFQNFVAERTTSKYAGRANYQKENEKDNSSMLEMLKKYELSDEQYFELKKFSEEVGVLFLSTPKDILSAKLLLDLNIELFKVGSSEINNFDFLKFLAESGRPIILSTGMSYLGEVEEAVNCIQKYSKASLSLLHCTSRYPCAFEDVNLRAMQTLKSSFKLPVGYSDHTVGIHISVAAVAMGAQIIEKHFTLDNNMIGPDHKVSLNPEEFFNLTKSIRDVEQSLGTGVKNPTSSELSERSLLRRGLVYSRDIKAGELITKEHLAIKRPGTGLEPKFAELILNRRANKDLPIDLPVEWKDIN